MIGRVGLLAFAIVLLAPTLANADPQGQVLMKGWASSDRCSLSAYRAFPDYTAEALAKRNQAYQQCLAGSNLPPPNRP